MSVIDNSFAAPYWGGFLFDQGTLFRPDFINFVAVILYNLLVLIGLTKAMGGFIIIV